MDVSIAFTGAPDGDDGPFYLGRSADLLALDRQTGGCPALAELIRSGIWRGTDALARELANTAGGPLVATLRELIGVGHPAETAAFVGPDSDDDADHADTGHPLPR